MNTHSCLYPRRHFCPISSLRFRGCILPRPPLHAQPKTNNNLALCRTRVEHRPGNPTADFTVDSTRPPPNPQPNHTPATRFQHFASIELSNRHLMREFSPNSTRTFILHVYFHTLAESKKAVKLKRCAEGGTRMLNFRFPSVKISE